MHLHLIFVGKTTFPDIDSAIHPADREISPHRVDNHQREGRKACAGVPKQLGKDRDHVGIHIKHVDAARVVAEALMITRQTQDVMDPEGFKNRLGLGECSLRLDQ